MNIPFTQRANVITVNNVSWRLVAPVVESLEFDGALIVCCKARDDLSEWKASEPDMCRNIYAFNPDGSMRWQIAYNNDEKVRKIDIYTGVSVRGDTLTAYNWTGWRYLVDSKTGAVVRGDLEK